MPSITRAVFILLTGLLCSYAVILDTEKQKENEGQSVVTKPFSQDQATGPPEMPQNLQAIPQSSSIVMLVWSMPSSDDVRHYLVYVENEDREATTDINYYIWEDLEPCKTYTFGVIAISLVGGMSEAALIKGETEAEIPPAMKDVRVTNYTFSSVTLAWENPETPCPLKSWKIITIPWSLMTKKYITSYTLTDLLPNTTYRFYVSALTYAGEGPRSMVNQTTAPYDGGPPEHLSAEAINSSAILVSWSAPIRDPLYYVVESVECMQNKETVYGLTYLITDLQPCQHCLIEVTSYYDDDAKFKDYTSEEIPCSEQ